jgi:hypothetical protein
MNTRISRSPKPPTLHTLIIGDVRTAWEKMYWDVDLFGDAQRSFPEEQEPLAYLALNACIAVSSLENWSLTEWKRQRRKNNFKAQDTEFYDVLESMIPHQGLCVDVANTTKHGSHRELRWKGGELGLRYDEASEHCPPGFVVLKLHENGTSYLYNDLHDLPRLWWAFLRAVDLVSGEQPTPDWWQRKVTRLFNRS